ncbi:MAG: hypothetical protein ABJC63_01455 [Gemmatimonadales bacterium]
MAGSNEVPSTETFTLRAWTILQPAGKIATFRGAFFGSQIGEIELTERPAVLPRYAAVIAINVVVKIVYFVIPIRGNFETVLLGSAVFNHDAVLNAGILEWGYRSIWSPSFYFFDGAAGLPLWMLPKEWHRIATGFAFGFSLITPSWMANVFVGLADAPYAAFFLASMLLAIRILVSPSPFLRSIPLFWCSSFSLRPRPRFRYTAPVLFVLAAVLVKGRMEGDPIPRKLKIWGPVRRVGARYDAGLLQSARDFRPVHCRAAPVYQSRGKKRDPHQLSLPGDTEPDNSRFALGFSRSPYIDPYHAQFGATHGDITWSLVGECISIVVLLGLWRTRTLSGMMPASARKRIMPIAGIATGCVLIAGLIVGVSTRRSTSGRAELSLFQSVRRIPDYFAGVTDTYRPLKTFMDGLPHNQTIIATSTVQVRWSVISGVSYYMADSGLVNVTRKKDVYIVVECQSLDTCAHLDANEAKLKDALCRVGEFNYALVFEARASRSRARVYRVRPA